jgi:hypothetical protein
VNGFLVWAAVLGPALLAEALLARHEVLAYSVGWRAPTDRPPDGVPEARGAAADRPPDAYLVYLDGIGKRRFHDSRDGGRLVQALIDRGPELRVLGQVLPYSPLVDPLAERPVWARLRRRAGLLLFLHNVMQIFVAADRRYRPLYNRAVGSQIAARLTAAGYRPGSGTRVVLLSYSGGAQVAAGAVGELHARLRCPLVLISIGGFHNGANDLATAEHVHVLTSTGDRIERAGTWIFPALWPAVRWSRWNRARRAGSVTVHHLEPATHVGPLSYISPSALLPDGRSHLDRTVEVVLDIVRSARGPAEGAPLGITGGGAVRRPPPAAPPAPGARPSAPRTRRPGPAGGAPRG